MLFIQHPQLKKRVTSVLFVLLMLFSMGCFHEFYKVKKTSLNNFKEQVNTGTVENPDYYIIHHRDQAMHLSDPYFKDGNLHGTLSELPLNRYRDPITVKEPTRYRPKEKYILDEVHLYLSKDPAYTLEPGAFTVPGFSVSAIMVIDKDNGATIANHVAGILGFATPIVAATVIKPKKSAASRFPDPPPPPPYAPADYKYYSCPFVYANNSHTFQLQGEVFAGAIFPQLERHDYLPLPNLTPVDNGYQIRITNEQPEYHHINLANLMVVEHPKGSKVLLDKTGKAHTVSDPQIPKQAVAPNGKDLLPLINRQDFNIYYYEEGDLLQNHIDMSFEKPDQAAQAKLILNGRSSYWSTVMFGSMTQMLGNTYPQWAAHMAELPVQNVHRMMDAQGLRLGIYLWTGNEWQLIDQVEQIGPVAFRDVIIPVDLTHHQGKEIRIKIEGGHLFWEMDYAAMDFTPNLQVNVSEYQPGYAIASDGKVYTKALGKDDMQYLELPTEGQQVTIWYPAVPGREGFQTSTFLHSKGYYEHLHEYDFPPDMANFPELDKAGTFIQYSKDRFENYIKTHELR